MSSGCAVCHTIGGTEARGTVGPDLTHFKSRSTIAAGTLANTRANLTRWIRESAGDQARRAHAGAFRSSRRELNALVVLSGDAQVTRRTTAASGGSTTLAAGAVDDDDARRSSRRGASDPGFWGWLTSVDHKSIGKRYIVTAFLMFIAGGIEAALMRTQLARPENTLIGPDRYNQLFTMHGTTMMFLFAVPIMTAMGLYFVPLMVGARNVAFPRLNAFGYWTYFVGVVFLYVSFFANTGPDTGWFAYVPLSGPGVFAGPSRRRLGAGGDVHRDLGARARR